MKPIKYSFEVIPLIATRSVDERNRIVLPKTAAAQGDRFLIYAVRLPLELATKEKKYGILLVPVEEGFE